jgi:hypothetical protein
MRSEITWLPTHILLNHPSSILTLSSPNLPRHRSMHSRHQARYTHETTLDPKRNKSLYEFGQKQAAENLCCFHMLCAAIQGAYDIVSVPPDRSRGQFFERAGVAFGKYKEYALEDVLGEKLHPREDGTIHPGDIKTYAKGMRADWRCREGGILRCVREARPFWNMVLNYHSSAGTTGIKAWDRLFTDLKRSNFDKGLVQCQVCETWDGTAYSLAYLAL